MWPLEREALAVWADQLQAKGEPLGELVAISLRADELRRLGAAAVDVTELEAQAEALRLNLAEQLLGPGVGELPRLRLRWQHGVVRAMHLDRPTDGYAHRPRVVLETLTELMRRPALRFLDQLDLGAIVPGPGEFEGELLRALAQPECLARPRRLVLGPMPGRFRRLLRWDARPAGSINHSPYLPWLPPEQLEAAAAHGLTWMIRWGRVQSLPWAAGDHGARAQQLERMLAQPWSPALARPLERAIWDTSLKLRRRLIAALPELPDDMAPALLAALAVDLDGRHSFGDLVQRSVTRAASERPRWVEAVALNFSDHEPWVARWLAGLGRRSKAAAAPAIPRVAGMLARAANDHRGHSLRRAHKRFGATRQTRQTRQTSAGGPLDDETIAELLEKIGASRRTQR